MTTTTYVINGRNVSAREYAEWATRAIEDLQDERNNLADKVARQRRILSAAEKAATTPGATAYDVKAAMAAEWANIHGSPSQEHKP